MTVDPNRSHTAIDRLMETLSKLPDLPEKVRQDIERSVVSCTEERAEASALRSLDAPSGSRQERDAIRDTISSLDQLGKRHSYHAMRKMANLAILLPERDSALDRALATRIDRHMPAFIAQDTEYAATILQQTALESPAGSRTGETAARHFADAVNAALETRGQNIAIRLLGRRWPTVMYHRDINRNTAAFIPVILEAFAKCADAKGDAAPDHVEFQAQEISRDLQKMKSEGKLGTPGLAAILKRFTPQQMSTTRGAGVTE